LCCLELLLQGTHLLQQLIDSGDIDDGKLCMGQWRREHRRAAQNGQQSVGLPEHVAGLLSVMR
jgi:hypothetical protein